MVQKVKDTGWSRNVLKLLKGATVTVGIHEKNTDRGEGLSNAAIGAIHEYGLGDNPERSFLRSMVDDEQKDLELTAKRAFQKASKSRLSPAAALSLLGFKMRSAVRAKITARIPPPNAESTIKRKGSSTPLVDTKEMYNSIDFEVTDGV